MLTPDLHNPDVRGSTPLQDTVAKKLPRKDSRPAEVADLRDRVRGGDVAGAARLSLDVHGAEIFGFLIGALDDPERARVVYADFCQRVVSELESFQWECPLRIWLYALACRELRDRRCRRKRAPAGQNEVGLGAMGTASRRPAGLTGAIATVRRMLSEEERELLILRIDRALGWQELALTRLGEDAPPLAVASEAQLLRTRLADLLERVERLTSEHVRPR